MTVLSASPTASGSSGHGRGHRASNPDTQAFREGLQRVSIPAWIVNERGVFVWLNDAFIELFGDRIGTHYSSIVAPEHRRAVDVQFTRKLNGTPVTDYEVQAVTRNRERVSFEISSVRLDRATFCGAVFGMAVVGKATATGSGGGRLTPRQLEILAFLARGASTTQIATELVLSRETVRNHIRAILRELDAHSRLEAVVKARSLDLVED